MGDLKLKSQPATQFKSRILESILELVVAAKTPRLRDRRAHYASSTSTCIRDMYWSAIGEPETNSADQVGAVKMFLGSVIGDALAKSWFSNLHWYGIHPMGTEVTVGGSNPSWDGRLDVLVADKQEDGSFQKQIIEIKTAYGFGGDKVVQTREAKEEYLAQIGLYLKDAHEKGLTRFGSLFYCILSDKNFGTLLEFECEYDPENTTVHVVRVKDSFGVTTEGTQSFNVQSVLNKFKLLDGYIERRETPAPEYTYKYPLTQELLESLSDDKLRKMIRGERVEGDWQVIYSRYKNKQLQVDGIKPGYSDEEIARLKAYYRTRHPKSKI